MADAALQTNLRQIREATVKEHVDAENRHDPDATDWSGILSTDKSFNSRMGLLYEFEGDQLVRERVYMDFGEMARQGTTS